MLPTVPTTKVGFGKPNKAKQDPVRRVKVNLPKLQRLLILGGFATLIGIFLALLIVYAPSSVAFPDFSFTGFQDPKILRTLMWIGIVAGVLLFVFSIQSRLNSTGEREKKLTGDGAGMTAVATPQKDKDANAGKKTDGYPVHPILYIIYVILAWFVLMGILWVFNDELRAYDWIWNTQQKLFWGTPFLVLAGIWFARMKSVVIKTLGALIWTLLAVIWILALYKSPVLFLPEESSRAPTIETGNQSAEAFRTRELVTIAKPNEWGEKILTREHPLHFYTDESVFIRVNGQKEIKWTPGRYIDMGKEVSSLEFMSVENKEVSIRVVIYP